LYVANLPFSFSSFVSRKLKTNGNGGRPNFLKELSKTHDLLNEVLNICELAWIKNRSPRSISKRYKTSNTTIWRILQELQPDKRAIVQYLKSTPTRKRFYNRELDQRDYETVTAYIQRARRFELRNHKRNIKNAERCWRFLNYKDPKNWSAIEILDFLATLSRTAKSCMLDAVRCIAPQIADKKNPEYLATGRFRERIGIRKKEIFGDHVQLIKLALREKGYRYELLVFLLHVTTGAREGSKDSVSGVTGLSWDRFKKNFRFVDDFESKVRQGIWWRDCPIDLFFKDLPQMLRDLWKDRGKPTTDKLILGGYKELTSIYKIIRAILLKSYKGKLDADIYKEFITLRPHDADKIHCNLLWEAGVPLEVVAGQYLGHDEGKGLVGRGWLNTDTIKKHYLCLTEKSEKFRQIRQQITLYSQKFNS
jgi:hypothetical protein